MKQVQYFAHPNTRKPVQMFGIKSVRFLINIASPPSNQSIPNPYQQHGDRWSAVYNRFQSFYIQPTRQPVKFGAIFLNSTASSTYTQEQSIIFKFHTHPPFPKLIPFLTGIARGAIFQRFQQRHTHLFSHMPLFSTKLAFSMKSSLWLPLMCCWQRRRTTWYSKIMRCSPKPLLLTGKNIAQTFFYRVNVCTQPKTWTMTHSLPLWIATQQAIEKITWIFL